MRFGTLPRLAGVESDGLYASAGVTLFGTLAKLIKVTVDADMKDFSPRLFYVTAEQAKNGHGLRRKQDKR